MKPQALSRLDIAFSTDVSHLMPKYDEIPEDFKRHHNQYAKLVNRWFFQGLAKSKLKARPDIDANTAFGHLSAIMGSFEPRHEHKIAAVAYLMSQWFEIAK